MSSERKDNPSYLSQLPPGDQKALAKTAIIIAVHEACPLTPEQRRKRGDINPLLEKTQGNHEKLIWESK